MTRKLIPFGVAIVLAFVVVALSRIAKWDSGPVYGVAGFFAGLLLALGTPFAFGTKAPIIDKGDRNG